MTLASISPEDAISNIAGWAKYFGIDDIPTLLSSPSVDKWVTVIGAVLVVASFAAFGLKKWSNFRRPVLPVDANDEERRADDSLKIMIDECRTMVADYHNILYGNNDDGHNFREYIQQRPEYQRIRKYLLPGEIKLLEVPTFIIGAPGGTIRDPYAAVLTVAIDRIQSEHNL